MYRRSWLSVALLLGGCVKGSAVEPANPGPHGSAMPDAAVTPDEAPASPSSFCLHREAEPPRTVVERPCGTRRAVLTDGARTAVLDGGERLFGEATAANAVRTRSWVRPLPAPFSGSVDAAVAGWLEGAIGDERADLLTLAMQYIEGAPAIVENGLQVAGDADYGPLNDLGARVEGADFNDYLGVRWSFPEGTGDRPKPEMLHSLDCSGYMRMLWGYRSGLPLAAAQSNTALSRRAVQMAGSPFGVTIISDGEPAATLLGRLQPGDLVFFDADPLDGPAIDHVGMALGRDEGGHLRFISSRKSPNGPTLGDAHGASILDGAGLYARSFRVARRL
jgi:hypothetical protein